MPLLDRVFAAAYDRLLAPSEVRGLAGMREALLGQLGGTVVEIGAGTGLNLPHYHAGIDRLVLTEPSRPMVRHLEDRRAHDPPEVDDVEVIEAPGHALPLVDDAADHAVSTLVLCTVPDLERTAAELARVLRPGGTLALLEHVGDTEPTRKATVQRVLEPPWKVVARGCHLTRDPRAALAAAGFDVSGLAEDRIPGSMSLVERALVGHATLRA